MANSASLVDALQTLLTKNRIYVLVTLREGRVMVSTPEPTDVTGMNPDAAFELIKDKMSDKK